MTMQENYLTEENDIPQSDIKRLCDNLRKHSQIAPALYEKYNVNRGLRHSDGSGVVAGITRICSVHGYVIDEGERRPVPGELIYRGYSIKDLVENAEREDRFLFEEIVYLLLMGELPTADELDVMRKSLAMRRELPPGFLVDSIMQAPSKNIMNGELSERRQNYAVSVADDHEAGGGSNRWVSVGSEVSPCFSGQSP